MKETDNILKMADSNNIQRRKKDSAKLIWDSKPKRAPNPKDIEFQTAEIIIPSPHSRSGKITRPFG